MITTHQRTARVFRIDTTGMSDDSIRELTAAVADAVVDYVDEAFLDMEDEGDE